MKRAFISIAGLLAVLMAWLALRQLPHVADQKETPDRTLSQAVGPPPGSPPQDQKPVSQPTGGSEEKSGQQAPSHLTAAPGPPPPARRFIRIGKEFVEKLATGPELVSFALPDGRTASGIVEMRKTAADGSPVGVSGRLTAPSNGRFSFHLQPQTSGSGPVFGAVVLENEDIAFRVLAGPGGTSELTELPADEVICRSYIRAPEQADVPMEIPADHPASIPIPAYQNGVIPLQSRPGALGVVYLDFDGETGPHEYWGTFDAASPNVSNAVIKDVWTRVCEDFAPFNLNITTDLQVFLNAPANSRQRCIITPTNTAAPGAGGVAILNTFASSDDIPCWAFYSSGKNSAEVISHEIGHTLGLDHDGTISPAKDYYLGHGTDPVGWAPIMGAAYSKNLSQWSKGEYLSANQPEDDIAVIIANSNVDIRTDEAGATHATSTLLEIFAGGVVNSQGTIETRSDLDAFRFTTTGGPVSLAVSPVPTGPDLDISASICDAAGNPVVSDNPDTALNASLTTTLAAGEYSVRIDGTGRGSPLADGYSDYGSLGQFTISGTITGAILPDRFNIAENSPAGTLVGAPVPRNNHGGAALTYSISAGNTGSAFAIHPSTGVITVATPSVLNYETLSTSWTTPPALALTVNVTDPLNPALNESLRVVVSVTNVNESPTISGPSSIIVISHTVNDTPLASVSGSDPDAFDFPVYSISSGNAGGKFAINHAGLITVAGDLDATVQSSYPLIVRATDHGTPGLYSEIPISVTVIPAAATYTPGFVYQTFYEGITGSTINSLASNAAFPTKPTAEIRLGDFTATTRGDDYGSTVRAWLIAPYTGKYQFWISGDQIADLYFSSVGNSSATTRICYLNGPTSYQQWANSGSPQSTTFNLTAGQVCYLEVRHKESTGNDHLSVAWQIRNSANTATLLARSVIPGRYLAPHKLNYAPKVAARAANLYRNSYAASSVDTVVVNDLNPSDTHTWSITGGNSAGIFAIHPATGELTVANAAALAASVPSTLTLTVTATDNGTPSLSGSGTFTVNLLAAGSTPTAGIYQEIWDNIGGTSLSSLYAASRYPNRPDRIVNLTGFDSGADISDNYGARIRAFVIPPVTGSYTFYLASDNSGTLLLSPDANPANASQVASVATYTSYQSWTNYPSQTSAPVTLTAGQRYFIEGRVKESNGGDHLSVAWTGPSVPTITVIGDADTEPFDSNIAPAFTAASYAFTLPAGFSNGTLAGTVTATDSPFEEIRYSIISGNPQGALAIDPATGSISVANAANLSLGQTYNLQIGAQDSGHGRRFAPRESLAAVTVNVPGVNVPPVFAADPVAFGSFPAGQLLSVSIASSVSDPGDVLTFAKISGPSWLTVSPAGLLSGTPDFTQFGSHSVVVSADDGRGQVVHGNAWFTVSQPAAIPATVLTANNATASLTTGSVTSGSAASASFSDNTHLILREAAVSGTSALDYRWTFTTPPNLQAALRIEAHHAANSEGDDFRFSVSTNGGATFTDAVLVTKTADDNTTQSFSFQTGAGNSTIVRVIDTNRTNGNNSLDSISVDLLAIEHSGNTVPSVVGATYQVASHSRPGAVIGNISATDAESGQSLSFSLPRGNEAGHFAISPSGSLSIASDIPAGAGPFTLVVVATDDGSPALANYALVGIEVVPPLPASVFLSDLEAVYDGGPHEVTVTTDPPGLPVTVTYDGSTTPPSQADSYQVVATILSATHAGSATGILVIRQDLIVAQGQTISPPDPVPTYQSLTNHGTLVLRSGTLHIAEDAANHGILRLTGDAALDISGSFTNTGFIDIINWTGTLPPGLVNTGSIIDRSSVRVLSTSHDPFHFNFTIPGFDGHLYQLESAPSPADPWTAQGAAIPGSGSLADPPTLEFSPAIGSNSKFFRVRITPAP